MHKLLVFSDLHLSRRFPASGANWETCLAAIGEAEPDMVVLGGDLVFNDPDSAADHAYAAAALARIDRPYRIVPGNHDLGDGPSLTAARLHAYGARYGADRWSMPLGDWQLIGLNSSLFDSGLEPEAEQMAWLAAELESAAGRPVLLFQHKPLCLVDFGETEVTADVMTPRSRAALLAVLHGSNVRGVVSGHLHCPRDFAVDGLRMIWAPSTGMVTDRDAAGHKRAAGWLSVQLEGEAIMAAASTDRLRPVNVSPSLARFGGTLGGIPDDVLASL